VSGCVVHEEALDAFGRSYEEFEVGGTYRHWPGKTVTEYDHLFCRGGRRVSAASSAPPPLTGSLLDGRRDLQPPTRRPPGTQVAGVRRPLRRLLAGGEVTAGAGFCVADDHLGHPSR